MEIFVPLAVLPVKAVSNYLDEKLPDPSINLIFYHMQFS